MAQSVPYTEIIRNEDLSVDGIDTSIMLGQLQGIKRPRPASSLEEVGPGKALESFGQLLNDHLNQLNELDEQAETLQMDYAVGKPVELHNVMIAESKADLAMELTMQIRNKAISAYQEVWRMGI